MEVSAIGLSWYRREDYERVLAIFEDSGNLPDTYDDFLLLFEEGKKKFENKGKFVIKVIIDPYLFSIWCKANGFNLNSAARQRFTAIEAARQIRESN